MKKQLFFLFVTAPLFCAPIGFDNFCRTVYEKSPQMVAALAQNRALAYEKDYALSFEPLSLELARRNIQTDESKKEFENSAMLGFSFKTPWAKNAEEKSFESKSKSLLVYEELLGQMLKISVKKEYLLYLLSKEEESVSENKVRTASDAFLLAEKKFGAGRISKIELASFEIDLFNSKRELEVSRMRKEELQDSLRSMALSSENIEIIDLKLDLHAADDLSFESLAEGSLHLKELASNKEELESEIKLYRASHIDKLGFGVGYTKEQTQKSVDFRISIPLGITGKNEKKIASLMSLVDGVSKKKQILKERLKLNAKTSSEKIQKIKERALLLVQNEYRYKMLYEMTKKGFDGGVVSLFEFLSSQNRYFDALSKTIACKREYVEEIAKTEENLARIIR